MENAVYLQTTSNIDEYVNTKRLKLPLESLVTYCVYKLCAPKDFKVYFVYQTSDHCCITLNVDEDINYLCSTKVPWSVSMCVFPVLFHIDTVITGLCAVARYICKYRLSAHLLHEHEEGLLGFRKCCLQAPNEVSIWTKFCEIEIIACVKNLLTCTTLSELPLNLVRFENHLSKPVKLHNVYKLARELEKASISNDTTSQQDNTGITIETNQQRTPKQRKWKSNSKNKSVIDNSTNIEDLNISHKYSEGPFLTLADVILYPLFYIVKELIGNKLSSYLPLTDQWLNNLYYVTDTSVLATILKSLNLVPLQIDKLTIPDTENLSLYKCDPKRHNPKKRLYTKEEDIESALTVIVKGMQWEIIENNLSEVMGPIIWSEIPKEANPTAGHLPDVRTVRKTQQLENLTLAVISIAKEGDIIVDFCCGSGHLGILLAYLLPKCTIILLENKEQSLLRARRRVYDMKINNVYFYQCNLDFFVGKFDIGIGLHACGIASDLVLDKCLKANAKFVLCPCCYGSLHATDRLMYPRSDMFSKMKINQYLCIGHAADQTHEDHPLTIRGERCMVLIDSDRAHLAKQHGYNVTLSKLKPLNCTPKNNLLIGVPS